MEYIAIVIHSNKRAEPSAHFYPQGYKTQEEVKELQSQMTSLTQLCHFENEQEFVETMLDLDQQYYQQY